MFPDAELAYMWYAYFCSTIGQTLIQEVSMLVQTDESIRLLCLAAYVVAF